jgi:hypothetical protein
MVRRFVHWHGFLKGLRFVFGRFLEFALAWWFSFLCIVLVIGF